MEKFRAVFIFCLILILLASQAKARVSDFYDSLPYEDQEIYLTTLHKCRSLSKWGSWWTGIDAEVTVGSFTGIWSLATFDLKAAEDRFKSNMMSPILYRKLHSPGYIQAIEHCFGDSNSSTSSKLARQGVVVGLLMSEVVGTGGAIYFIAKGGAVMAAFSATYPLLAASLMGAYATVEQWKNRHQFAEQLDKLFQRNSIGVATDTSKGQSDTKKALLEIARNQMQNLIKRQGLPDLTREEREEIKNKIEQLKQDIEQIKILNI